MFKSLVVFFRKRSIKEEKQKKRTLSMPDVSDISALTLMMDVNHIKNAKEIEAILRKLFAPKKYRFLIYCDTVPNDQIYTDVMCFITKADFNILGRLRKEKIAEINAYGESVVINMAENNTSIVSDYVVSLLSSSFKVGHDKLNNDLHDLILNFGIENSLVERLKILHKYLLMLSGKKNEK